MTLEADPAGLANAVATYEEICLSFQGIFDRTKHLSAPSPFGAVTYVHNQRPVRLCIGPLSVVGQFVHYEQSLNTLVSDAASTDVPDPPRCRRRQRIGRAEEATG
jgi:hypothetical protein